MSRLLACALLILFVAAGPVLAQEPKPTDGAPETPAAGAPDPAATPGNGGLVGVHLWAQVTPQAGTRIIRYLFRADGTFVTGRAFAGGETLDFAEAAKKFPAEAGTYRVEGAALTLQFADGTSRTKELVEKEGRLRIRAWQLGIPFPDDHRLDVSFEAQGGVAIAGATGDQAQRWVFRPDGSFEVAEGRVADAGAGATHAHTAEQLAWKGSYRLHGFTLTLTFGEGQTKDFLVFLSGEEVGPAPKMLFLDMGNLKRAK